MTATGQPKRPADMTDEELADALREQVNKSRHSAQGHNRARTRAISAEMRKRGWMKN